jgi:hypothetical protein
LLVLFVLTSLQLWHRSWCLFPTLNS